MAIFYLVLRFLIVDLFSIFISFNGAYCAYLIKTGNLTHCKFLVSGYSLKSAIDQPFLNFLDVLELLFTILSIVYFIVFRRISFKMFQWVEFSEQSEDTFSVFLENIPHIMYSNNKKLDEDFKYQEILKDKIEKIVGQWIKEARKHENEDNIVDQIQKDFWKLFFKKYMKESIENMEDNTELNDKIVANINICYDLTQLENINHCREDLIDKYMRGELKDEEDGKEPIEIYNQQMELLNSQYVLLCKNFIGGKNVLSLSNFTGKAFVSFQFQHYRDYFLSLYQRDPDFFKINSTSIKVEKACAPRDVLWENMNVKNKERMYSYIFSWAILTLILILTFAIIVVLRYLAVILEKLIGALAISLYIHIFVSALLGAITTFMNLIMAFMINFLTKKERHKTITARLLSIIIKTIIGQTANTIIVYFFVYLAKPINPLLSLGLVGQVYSLLLTSALIYMVKSIWNPKSLWTKCMNKYHYKYDQKIERIQIQLNKEEEKPSFKISDNYSYYVIFSFLVSFYGFLIPLGSFLLILIFILKYWVDKWSMFKHCSQLPPFTLAHSRLVIKAFQFNIVFSALGYLFWQSLVHFDIPQSHIILNLINIILAGIFLVGSILSQFFPNNFTEKVFKQNQLVFKKHSYSHEIKRQIFRKRYVRQNPATSIKEHLELETSGQYVKNEEQIKKYLELEDTDKIIDQYGVHDVDIYRQIKKETHLGGKILQSETENKQ